MDDINFKRPELEDRGIISYFYKAPSRSCERTFSNVYLWSRHYHVKYAVIEDALIFRTMNLILRLLIRRENHSALKMHWNFL